ncbi:MAG: reverse transcriptase/maturase family protein [Phycisphaerae bacterium]
MDGREEGNRKQEIPKGDGKVRVLQIPTWSDKLLQRAVVMVLEAIYEQDFCDCSYGFRSGRSAHDALNALWQQTMQNGGGWILELDDRENGFLYVLERFADEAKPVVHVWSVR